MTAPCLPGLFEMPTKAKLHRGVRATSKAAYDGGGRFTGRKAEVLRWLTHYHGRFQEWPTSAELSRIDPELICEIDAIDPVPWGKREPPNFDGMLSILLYVRRGLSDLQNVGSVEAVPNGKRLCRISGRVCETWRVAQR